MGLNLAGDPFRNLRPLRRAGVLLIVLGLVLAALDARTYWRHFTGKNQTRVRLQELDAELAAERAALEELRGSLSLLDVETLNERAVFVNEQIARRTFSWSGLFDDLVEILPNDAHLVSLQPNFGRDRRERTRGELAEDEVALEIEAVARDGERLLGLIDALFEHPAFREPDLQRESQDETVLKFVLSVVYRPGAEMPPEPPPAAEASDGPETADPPADPPAEEVVAAPEETV